MIINILSVGCGGFIGAVLRYGVASFISRLAIKFPIATLSVNILGSFLFGLFFEIFLVRDGLMPKPAQLFLFVGLLGGFTTFSSFSRETHQLFTQGDYLLAFLNILSNFTLCLVAVFAGHIIGGNFK